MYCWYFEIISAPFILLVFPLLDIPAWRWYLLLNTQCFKIRYWRYRKLKARKQIQQTIFIREVHASMSPSSPPPLCHFILHFPFFWGVFFYLSGLGTFLSGSCKWDADGRCRLHVVQILMPFPFSMPVFLFLSAFLLVINITSELKELFYKWCDQW